MSLLTHGGVFNFPSLWLLPNVASMVSYDT